MGLDHSNAFVRVTFDGLIAFCINERADPNSCEMGMVHVENHKRLLVVIRINPNGTEEVHEGPFELDSDNDIFIVTEKATNPGAHVFEPDLLASGFDRLGDKGDPEDFRWVMDLQGPLLHEENLTLNREDEKYKCRPRIFISDGIFYTHSKTPHKYFRFPREGNPTGTGVVRMGKLADKVGADIVCDPLEGIVTVKIGEKKNIELKSDGLQTRYRIDVTNLCDPKVPKCPATSDFTHYYDVASDIDGIEFDLQYEKVKGTPGNPKPLSDFLKEKGFNGPLPAGFEELGSNGPPQVCNVGFFGKTNTIP